MRKSVLISLLLSQGAFLALLPFITSLTSYLHPIVLVVFWICLTALVFFFVFWIRKDSIPIPYSFFTVFIVIYNIGLLILLFFRPSNQSYDTWNLIPFETISFYFTGEVPALVAFYNLAANVGLFIPWGLFIMTRKLSHWQKLYLPFILILLIETTQFITKRGSFDIDDLILNVIGVFLGYAFYPIFMKVIRWR